MAGDDEVLVGRAVRLFQFLADAQKLRSSPVLTVESYEHVVWLAEVPGHAAVRMPDPDASPIGTVLDVARVPVAGPPGDDGTSAAVRALYDQLFTMYQEALNRGDEVELVLAWGCLSWLPPDGHAEVRRHLLTTPAVIEFLDHDGGRLVVGRPDGRWNGLTVEDDMVSPSLIAAPSDFGEAQQHVRDLGSDFDRRQVVELSARLVRSIDVRGRHVDEGRPPAASATATVVHAPAIILRKRSQHGLIRALDGIAEQLARVGRVPDGLRPLVDVDHVPGVTQSWADEPGARISAGDTEFLPLPVNDRQLDVLRSVDTRAQTLVQGPPGTGKTHTAAALVSHLLAQGRRVLVTAATDQALKELRGRLPAEIQRLSVAVLQGGADELADLKASVQALTTRAAEHDDRQAGRQIDDHLAVVDDLCRVRLQLYERLVGGREAETKIYRRADGREQALDEITREHEDGRAAHEWLLDLATPGPGGDPPLDGPELARLRDLLLDADLAGGEESEAHRTVVDAEATGLPPPREFAALVAREERARAVDRDYADAHQLTSFSSLRYVDAERRPALTAELARLAGEIAALSRRDEAWVADALDDVREGRSHRWQARAIKVRQMVARADVRARRLVDPDGASLAVRVQGGVASAQALVPLAENLRRHLVGGGQLKTDATGRPRMGLFSPQVVTDGADFFEKVTVNRVPATTPESLTAFLQWVEAQQFLATADQAWSGHVTVPDDGTVTERLQWHLGQLRQLERVLTLADDLARLEAELAPTGLTGLTAVPWPGRPEAGRIDRVAEAVDAREELAAATRDLNHLRNRLDPVVGWSRAGGPGEGPTVAPCVVQLYAAVQDRDPDGYQEAWDRIGQLREVETRARERDRLLTRLSAAAPRFVNALITSAADPVWTDRIAGFGTTWRWATMDAWLSDHGPVDVNRGLARIDAVEREIRRRVEHIAAGRAWRHAVSEPRLSSRARADLQQYVQLLTKLGKGTGKYAAQQQREVREAMDRCRPSVPVWIMPIYRVVEQLDIAPDLFDVVIVDEASQAGLEAAFLQYLAPRMVVIGDDKQVSPSAVGVDQQELRDLAERHLYDNVFRASWQDPLHSFFDTARLRYDDLITLTEHRRCVPEIIGFSNGLAYEPEGLSLVPVRQYGTERLEPVKAVQVDGRLSGRGQNRFNPVEADAIVDQIVRCLADPAYDGRTFGVISLLGSAQAGEIERRLLDRVGPEVMEQRSLRCGHPPDFQGSERDVIFLSMVAVPEEGRRLGVLTQDHHRQRYNVAASRARDQMWLFHSVARSDIENEDCMRHRLLDSVYSVPEAAGREVAHPGPVADDLRVAPFDSLFEQQVFNALCERGFAVIPQHEIGTHRIDLVVAGPRAKVAVECDGDHWQGPERYQADLARQRDLERCGWSFFRVRESSFRTDPAGALAPLWDLLAAHGIRPPG